MVFRTTRKFLELFGLRDAGDLPTLKELESLEK
jgi:chromosome segregation and condensation protein ScpB